MKGIYSIFIFFAAVLLAPCSATAVANPADVATLKGMLDWVSGLKASQQTRSATVDLNDTLLGGLTSQAVNVESMVNEAINDADALRKLLLKEQSGETTSSLNVRSMTSGEISLFLEVLPSMYDSLLQLHEKVKETKGFKSSIDGTTTNTKLTQGAVSGWLQTKGFNSDNININTTLEDLNNKLTEILTENKPIYKIPSLYATYYMTQKPENLGERLAWLLLFSSSLSNKKIEDGLKEHVRTHLPNKTDELVSSLKSLSEHNGPIMNLIGTGTGNTLYPFSKMHSKPGKFADPNAGKYFGTLSDVCNVIEDELKEVEKKFSTSGASQVTSPDAVYLRNKGFDTLGVTVLSGVPGRIQELIGSNKPLNKVCSIVKAYGEKVNPKAHRSEASTSSLRSGNKLNSSNDSSSSSDEESASTKRSRESNSEEDSLFMPLSTVVFASVCLFIV
ncbi:hypothetical protein BgAZ_202300 [Babesia gibsoni]|uniref:Uncharacterized protein n=1 Tax=Babesia gibsoni TaxID=33632 RepID=A0AAD8LJF7_BABGI|nr:hypothetical protein BgAZ_202300 [Babesia gibsoni]